jgi:hypothetical protein
MGGLRKQIYGLSYVLMCWWVNVLVSYCADVLTPGLKRWFTAQKIADT